MSLGSYESVKYAGLGFDFLGFFFLLALRNEMLMYDFDIW